MTSIGVNPFFPQPQIQATVARSAGSAGNSPIWASPAPQFAPQIQQASPVSRSQAPGWFNQNVFQPAWNGVKQGWNTVSNFAAQHPVATGGMALGAAGLAMGCPYSAGMGAASAIGGFMSNRAQ